MLSSDGYVAEATGDNIFILSGEMLTPPPHVGILEGITRHRDGACPKLEIRYRANADALRYL